MHFMTYVKHGSETLEVGKWLNRAGCGRLVENQVAVTCGRLCLGWCHDPPQLFFLCKDQGCTFVGVGGIG
jgi:hypothetical protein